MILFRVAICIGWIPAQELDKLSEEEIQLLQGISEMFVQADWGSRESMWRTDGGRMAAVQRQILLRIREKTAPHRSIPRGHLSGPSWEATCALESRKIGNSGAKVPSRGRWRGRADFE